jgi:hypothetical protein
MTKRPGGKDGGGRRGPDAGGAGSGGAPRARRKLGLGAALGVAALAVGGGWVGFYAWLRVDPGPARTAGGGGGGAPASEAQRAPFEPPAAPATGAPSAAGPEADGGAAVDPLAQVDRGGDPMLVFFETARDEAWAPVVEAALADVLRSDLSRMVPEARGLEVQCRRLACLFRAEAPRAKLPLVLDVLGFVTFGPITVAAPADDKHAQLLFITDRRMSDPHGFLEWYRRLRRRQLEEIRAGKRPNPLPVAKDKLPEM